MATTLLLLIIYLAFISLGLPDTILGVTIKSLQDEWGLPLASGGIISTIITGGTVISTFFSNRIINRVGTGKIVFISCLTTGLSLLGFSLSPSFLWLIPFALPLGLGGGTVDAALNNYVALNFKAHHMNWLHSFWGLGATLGPVIMSLNLAGSSWRGGYRTISIIQILFSLILLLSIPLWRKHKEAVTDNIDNHPLKKINIYSLKGVIPSLLTMFLYCIVEIGVGLWSSSFLIIHKGFTTYSAARFVAIYYLGITVGRFLSGFISFKLGNRELIRFGTITAFIGVFTLLFPLPKFIAGGSLVLTGLGLAPIFPAMIHETPRRFGKSLSQKIIGKEMAFAYIGSAISPPILGLIFQETSIKVFPYCFITIIIFLLIVSEILNRSTKSC